MMTIRKSAETGCMVAICDDCHDVVDFEDLDGTDPDDWGEVKNAIDGDGWRTIKGGLGKWRNICPDCL